MSAPFFKGPVASWSASEKKGLGQYPLKRLDPEVEGDRGQHLYEDGYPGEGDSFTETENRQFEFLWRAHALFAR